MFDPLATPFADDIPAVPTWPSAPHPNSPIPNLKRSPAHLPISPSSASFSVHDNTPASPGPYGREPQIYGAPDSGLISPKANTGSNGKKYERAEPYLRARITMLDRNRRDILIRFDAQTNLPNFTGSTYRNVSRSYAEFQQLYETIVHNNPQTIVSALPLAQTSAPTDEEDDRLVKIMLQRWLTRVCEDPFLMRDEETRSFIESDFGYQPMPRPARKKSGSGFSLMKRGVPDEDETLQKARFELTKLEGQYFEAAKSIDRLARARKTLSVAQAELGNKLISVATAEDHPPLANALRKLGRTWHSVSDLDQAAAVSECVIIGDSLGYEGLNARSAKETLLQRTSVLEEHQAASKASISKRRNIERLKASSSINPSRVDEALEDLEDANKYEQILAQRVDGISHNLHIALQRHDQLVDEDVTTALIEHARSMLSYERQRLKELEALRPDFENADAKYIAPAPGPTRPAFIPKLDDDLKPAPPVIRAQSQQPSHPPLGSAASFRPPHLAPTPPSKSPQPQPRPVAASVASLPPQSPGAGPSTPTSPLVSGRNSPAIIAGPGPGPVMSVSGPPLGGKLVDGSKSVFVVSPSKAHQHTTNSPLSSIPPLVQTTTIATTPNSPLATKSTGHPALLTAQVQAQAQTHAQAQAHTFDPLGPLGPSAQPRRTLTSDSFSPPLGSSTSSGSTFGSLAGGAAAGVAGGDIDPLGLGTPKYMTQSMQLPPRPQQYRLSAREAASKLANF